MQSFKMQSGDGKGITPKQTLAVFGGMVAVIIFFVIMASGSNTTQETTTLVPVESTLSAAEAQRELDQIIDLGKQGKLISSYEFSDSDSVVYVTNVWYSQTVAFKKDFVAKIGLLKQAIKGYKHFEVRNYQSNEKVAELTSFSSSIEIYK